MNANEHEEISCFDTDGTNFHRLPKPHPFSSVSIREIRVSSSEIEIRTAHKIMAARTAQFALLVDQFMSATRAKPPMLAGLVRGRDSLSRRFGSGLV
jgi:hypothetical protein